MPRYVVLRHEVLNEHERPSHWDLMLEAEGVLWTWALSDEPAPQQELVAERLPDHRTMYLEYEGPISGDRGRVHRVMQGTFSFGELREDYIEVLVESGELPRRVLLGRLVDRQRWNITFDEER